MSLLHPRLHLHLLSLLQQHLLLHLLSLLHPHLFLHLLQAKAERGVMDYAFHMAVTHWSEKV